VPTNRVFANNAGSVFGDPAKTVDGFEKTFQINHLAPFLLTTLLMDTLIASNASVIQTSSIGARMAGPIDIDDLDHDRKFDPVWAYNAAKLENILFTKELNRRYADAGISAVAFHPGVIATSFGTQSTSRMMRFITTNAVARDTLLTSPEKGADQLVWLAERRAGIDWDSGAYCEKRRPKRSNRQPMDADMALRLWERSEELVA